MSPAPLKHLLALAMVCLGLSGEDRCVAETPRKETAISPAAQTVTNHLDEITVILVQKIREARAQGNGIGALPDMHQLMDRWSPVGLTKDRVIELLGKPSSINGQVMIYRFDNGEGGWQWEIEIDKGLVSKVHKEGLE